MSELPSSWVTAPLGEFTLDCGQRVPEEFEEFKYIDIGSVNRDTKRIVTPQQLLGKDAPSRARKHVRAGDVLVSMTRPNLNAVALVPDELDGQIASTGFDVLRASFGIEHRWVSYLVRTDAFVEAMSELVQGALYPAVRPRDIRGFEVPLAPLPEQKRIADKLDAVLARVDACRDRLDCIPDILRCFRLSVLAAATSGKLTEVWRDENVIIDKWVDSTVGDAAFVTKLAGFEYTKFVNYREGGDLKVIKGENAGAWGFKFTDFSTVYSQEVSMLTRSKLKEGDVLMVFVGTPGKVARVPSGDNWFLGPNIAMIRTKPELLNSAYLEHYCRSQKGVAEISSYIKSVAQSSLSMKTIRQVRISLPSINEQNEIVRRIEALFAIVDRIEARYTSARAQVEKLTPATLAKAFRGELVPQDPNDEPASMLLERIKFARADGATKPKRARTADLAYVPTKLKEKRNMTKSRQDDDVREQPYLAAHLRKLGGSARVESLFDASELPVADFYKQLAWEVSKNMVRDAGEKLELGDAA